MKCEKPETLWVRPGIAQQFCSDPDILSDVGLYDRPPLHEVNKLYPQHFVGLAGCPAVRPPM